MAERAIILLRVKDTNIEDKGTWRIKDNLLFHISNNKSVSYNCFDHVFNRISNEELFKKYLYQPVKDTFTSTNLTIFAYGQTGSGKTHSMFGNHKERGIIFYTVQLILSEIDEVSISFIEIYNEKIYDLIDPMNRVNLYNIGNDPKLTGNSIVKIRNIKYIPELLNRCDLNRKISSTEYNSRSSRSHTFFKIMFRKENKDICVNLIDLAGSEKASSDLERRKEGSFINKSLLALGTVINNLSKKEYTTFRESKLTRLLQPSMEGNSNLIALCLINPNEGCSDESISTLNFASRVGKIRFTSKVEEIPEENKEMQILCDMCSKILTKSADTYKLVKTDNQPNIKNDQITSDRFAMPKNQLNELHLKQNFAIKEKEDGFNNMKKQRITEDLSVYKYERNYDTNLIVEKEKKEEDKSQESESKNVSEKEASLEIAPSSFFLPNKLSTTNNNSKILELNPSREEPVDVFNIYVTDDSRSNYYKDVISLNKKEKIEEKVEYLEKKVNLYQERVEELEKVVYDMLINDIDNNQKDVINLERKMFYCKNKILDNQYEDFFN
ncbi:hypothetical protein H312_00398 [Anncaliia algerae PRA339]|uniref:Kinesin motor domain-containing protein n=1 Tax=Anncaliia algerae PRA339 TaxID=1288291 RepID=A0A059F4D7_9MICR|nr:hypothetical protein H312_00398 [Anncaliia algerae PRA339]